MKYDEHQYIQGLVIEIETRLNELKDFMDNYSLEDRLKEDDIINIKEVIKIYNRNEERRNAKQN